MNHTYYAVKVSRESCFRSVRCKTVSAFAVLPVILLCLLFGEMRVRADFFTPSFDASSSDSIIRSVEKFQKYAASNRDITGQQQLGIISFTAMISMQATAQALGNIGGELTQRDQDKAVAALFKKYNGLKPIQCVELFLKEQEEEARKKQEDRELALAKMRQEEDQKLAEQQKKDNESRRAFKVKTLDWLTGTAKADAKLAGYGDVEIKIVGEKLTAFINRPSYRGSIDSVPVIQAQFSARDNLLVDIKIDSGLSYRKSLFPFDKRFLKQESELLDVFWFLPKFKEWALKFEQLKDDEKPEQFIKEIEKTGAQIQNLSNVFFIFQKEMGAGILLWERGDGDPRYSTDVKRLNYTKSILNGGEKIALSYYSNSSWTVENVSKEIADKYNANGLGLAFPKLDLSYLRLGDIYLAEAAVTRLLASKTSAARGEGAPVDSEKETKRKLLENKLKLN